MKWFKRSKSRASAALRAAAVVMTLGTFCGTAVALDVLPDEKAGRKACEKSFCEIAVKRDSGGPLACDMVKTWDRDKITKSGESGKLTWGFGDARCSMKIELPREPLLAALKEPSYKVEVPEQTVTCEIEGKDGKVSKLTAKASPRLEFKNGKAEKLWLNVGTIEGDTVLTKFVWAGAKLFDGVGLMHGSAITEINRFIYEQCPEVAAQ